MRVTASQSFPEVDDAIAWLQQYGQARMTGTGSSVFTSFPDETTARDVLAQVPADLQGFVARGMNAHQHELFALDRGLQLDYSM